MIKDGDRIQAPTLESRPLEDMDSVYNYSKAKKSTNKFGILKCELFMKALKAVLPPVFKDQKDEWNPAKLRKCPNAFFNCYTWQANKLPKGVLEAVQYVMWKRTVRQTADIRTLTLSDIV